MILIMRWPMAKPASRLLNGRQWAFSRPTQRPLIGRFDPNARARLILPAGAKGAQFFGVWEFRGDLEI